MSLGHVSTLAQAICSIAVPSHAQVIESNRWRVNIWDVTYLILRPAGTPADPAWPFRGFDALGTVTTQADDKGEFVVLPPGIGFGEDVDVALEKIGDAVFMTHWNDRAARNEYRALLGLPEGE